MVQPAEVFNPGLGQARVGDTYQGSFPRPPCQDPKGEQESGGKGSGEGEEGGQWEGCSRQREWHT